ncbi:MAG: site-specific integrase, partial [Pseudolabrys sp.]|nr:site-specific integrase [Pseudolabrys sp.]
MSVSVNITKRERRRTLKSGAVVSLTRWVINYREPRTGKRRQLFFSRAADAQARRNAIVTEIGTGTYSENSKSVTVADAVQRWLANRDGEIKAGSLAGYRDTATYVIGPLVSGTKAQRVEYTRSGKLPEGTRLLPMLGHVKLQDLTTGQIRAWHKTVSVEVGAYSANRAKMYLAAALALAAEDMNMRPPTMPTRLGRGKPKSKKLILTTVQVSELLQATLLDRDKGIYVAFPFLAGTRPSEQLGLLWEDIDFDANVIHISRMQERDGKICDLTKTAAGTREIPMCKFLRDALLEWRLSCPRLRGQLHRVFPGPGHMRPWPLPRTGGGGPLLYNNFRNRVWVPMLKRLGLPSVTPHSARHSF